MKPNHLITRQQGSIIERMIADLPIDKIWEWIKTGKWNRKDYLRWFTVIRVIEPKKGQS